ncbi:MAG: hypothetical protein A3B74_00255 [Candidatus Kerfeldbacteria bacterium RIFCSPHIGHO2_02_FULL_42_14]|uniref:Methylamine utilisation protein MauE domain-containing protein n=1 Tax=Candidatus Kerfeldbacteria bacterium RIFCSPHIGHO2_02_FULL_42_14 TaxID=1798540 RepID=A0A1G2AQV4_9BACT|nr:MAG: hypothetical protein A3B74_00255 [Candidatus Kerfeldbacteria bacterium RIFCSPHIGHO2_02_FULL_42_14]OGY81292.1 MAG: hypothetical protein A3E60_02475 [Candidatus Kerfeldbacteria bacterium RIFCSPHIGHO2_12_FULL_42_13]OGY83567.1 MAG: hypothetical protein A3I91_02910 [Candidatus Kerfeldbacteria bacterium RIFCSPLOWO2_02_FULL_42_19]OGY86717.1 MAG: hypothetical protein A3G01_00710 [Candidatus Kerfeldbacteria bacterium RIFCSPLOWO2_12_FULL_43_9]
MSSASSKVSYKELICFILRVLVGSLFITSGILKLLQPTEEFIALVHGYRLLPFALVPLYARILPWFELVLGVFFLLGWYQKWAGFGIALLLVSFIIALILVLARNIPLQNCGCFGGKLGALLGEKPWEVLVRNFVLLGAVALVVRNQISRWSLDYWFSKKSL